MANAFRWQMGDCCGCGGTPGPCKNLIIVDGCQVLDNFGTPTPAVPGVRVEVFADAGLTELVDSGTTDAGGAWLAGVPSEGFYYVRLSRDRFITTVSRELFGCTRPYKIIPVNITPDPAYVCIPGCPIPIKRTLALSSTKGSATLTYGDYVLDSPLGGINIITGWLGRGTYNFPGSGPRPRTCPPKTCDALYFLEFPTAFPFFLMNTGFNDDPGVTGACPGNWHSEPGSTEFLDGTALDFLRTTNDFGGIAYTESHCDPFLVTLTATPGFSPFFLSDEILTVTES